MDRFPLALVRIDPSCRRTAIGRAFALHRQHDFGQKGRTHAFGIVSLIVLASAPCVLAEGVALKLQLPEGAKVASAVATEGKLKLDVPGTVGDRTVTSPISLPASLTTSA